MEGRGSSRVQWPRGGKLNRCLFFRPSFWPFPCQSLNYSRSLHRSPSAPFSSPPPSFPSVPPSLVNPICSAWKAAPPFPRSVFLRDTYCVVLSLSFCHPMGVPTSKHERANHLFYLLVLHETIKLHQWDEFWTRAWSFLGNELMMGNSVSGDLNCDPIA